MRPIAFISCIIFTLLSVQALAWEWPPGYIEIDPTVPTSADIVTITIGGDWNDSCIPVGSSFSILGNDIIIDVLDIPGGSCLFVITPWSQTQYVGPLADGTYNVYVTLNGIDMEWMAELVVSDKQFVVNTQTVNVPEDSTATFTVAILNDPCGTVEATVARQSGDTDITVQSGSSLTFDSSNYTIPQTVTLAAAEDGDYLDGSAVIAVMATDYYTSEVIAYEADNDIPLVIYVDCDAPGSETGTSWENAFTNLQDALSIADIVPEIEEIRMAEGIYTPAEPNGDRDIYFLVKDINVVGGYAGYGQSVPDARDPSLYKTVLSGDLNSNDGPGFANNGENSRTVVRCYETVKMDGLTITGGNGGGGAGIYNWTNVNLTMINCIVKNNAAAYGGGMYNNSGNISLINCMFASNVATEKGGGIRSQSCNLSLANCLFFNNSDGGMDGNPIFTNITMNNCVFWGNGDTSESAQIGSGQFTINHCCIQGWTGSLGGTGNIGDDPMFFDANGLDDILGTEDDNLRLLNDSPCIDTGDNTAVTQANDLDWYNRIVDGDCNDVATVDMGVYEFDWVRIGDFAGGCDVDFEDYSILALTWLLSEGQAGYDPVCDIGKPADKQIDIFDLDAFVHNWLERVE
jgi:predicted outer membrane repeat protein